MSRPVSCREMTAAILLTGADRDEAKRRLAALERWADGTIDEMLALMCGCGPTKRLRGATGAQRAVYAKLRRNGIGADEALRELGL